MAEISRPWEGTVLGDAGPYSDIQWEEVWATFRGPGYGIADVTHLLFEPGVFKDQLNELGASIPGNNEIDIASGRAMVNGKWYENDDVETLDIPTEAANDRIDRIVLRKSFAAQTIRLTVVSGAPGIPAAPPNLTQNPGVTWDLPLWQVYMALGVALPVLHRDERDYIGQYEPIGINGTKVYIEEEFFAPNAGFVSGSFIGPFNTVSTANAAVNALTGLAGFGTGALNFVHTGGGAGGDGARIESISYKPDLMNARLKIRAKVPNTDGNLDRIMGFVATGGTLIPANGVYFRADGAANWFAVTRAGGVETATDTGRAQDDTWRTFEIRQTGDDVVVFLIDGVVEATHITNIPSDIDLDLNIDTFDNGAAPANLSYHHLDSLTLRGDR